MRRANSAITMRPDPPGGAGAARLGPPQHVRPALCLVTDRRRLAAALGIAGEPWHPALEQQITGAIAGGVDVVQIREPDLEDRVLIAIARHCLRAAAGVGTRIVINNRVDVALGCGAHGVHLREDGIAPAAARRLGAKPFLIGRSVHSADAARKSADADYLIAGPVFETVSKAGHPGLGLNGFRTIARSAPCPVWAIGGMTQDQASALADAGAAGLAGIGAFIPSGPVRDLVSSVQHLVENLRFVFDSPSSVP
jgi:thiamine-phosphate pyrophosphorylase